MDRLDGLLARYLGDELLQCSLCINLWQTRLSSRSTLSLEPSMEGRVGCDILALSVHEVNKLAITL